MLTSEVLDGDLTVADLTALTVPQGEFWQTLNKLLAPGWRSLDGLENKTKLTLKSITCNLLRI